jgi:enamine deaminase RidA (YjgF/YER057c/UK114 family)
MSIESRLAELGLTIPAAPKPAGNYSATVRAGNLLFLSGQFSIENGALKYSGRVGVELSEEQGYAAARLAALNVLAQIQSALGSFERLEHLVRVAGHIASAPGWNKAPRVLDGVFRSIRRCSRRLWPPRALGLHTRSTSVEPHHRAGGHLGRETGLNLFTTGSHHLKRQTKN